MTHDEAEKYLLKKIRTFGEKTKQAIETLLLGEGVETEEGMIVVHKEIIRDSFNEEEIQIIVCIDGGGRFFAFTKENPEKCFAASSILDAVEILREQLELRHKWRPILEVYWDEYGDCFRWHEVCVAEKEGKLFRKRYEQVVLYKPETRCFNLPMEKLELLKKINFICGKVEGTHKNIFGYKGSIFGKGENLSLEGVREKMEKAFHENMNSIFGPKA